MPELDVYSSRLNTTDMALLEEFARIANEDCPPLTTWLCEMVMTERARRLKIQFGGGIAGPFKPVIMPFAFAGWSDDDLAGAMTSTMAAVAIPHVSKAYDSFVGELMKILVLQACVRLKADRKQEK
jgi:hypothetical protein